MGGRNTGERRRKGQEVGDLKRWEAGEKMRKYANISALYFTIKYRDKRRKLPREKGRELRIQLCYLTAMDAVSCFLFRNVGK